MGHEAIHADHGTFGKLKARRQTMDARKYWTMCRIHDWHYEMADDPDAYRNGRDTHETIKDMAEKDAALRPIYEAWKEYHYRAGAHPAEPKLEE
jgi:predicted hydrolase (HD superfamily)